MALSAPGFQNGQLLGIRQLGGRIDGLVRANDRRTMVRYAHALDRV